MPNIAPELILLRNEFYARSFRNIKLIVAILLLICALLIGLYIYQRNILKPMPKYFPTTPDGRIINSPPVSENHLLLSLQKVDPTTGIIIGMPQPVKAYADLQPYGEDALLLYWANLAVSDMFDYDYIHYRSVIQAASKYFTAIGHQNFIDALIASKNLETIKARSAVVIPEITGKVQILSTKLVEGHFSWDIEIPLRLTYASVQDTQPIVQNLLAKMSIARVTTLLSPFYGLAIYRLYFEELTNNQAG